MVDKGRSREGDWGNSKFVGHQRKLVKKQRNQIRTARMGPRERERERRQKEAKRSDEAEAEWPTTVYPFGFSASSHIRDNGWLSRSPYLISCHFWIVPLLYVRLCLHLCLHLHVSIYYNIALPCILHYGISVGDFHQGPVPVRTQSLPVLLLITLLITPRLLGWI